MLSFRLFFYYWISVRKVNHFLSIIGMCVLFCHLRSNLLILHNIIHDKIGNEVGLNKSIVNTWKIKNVNYRSCTILCVYRFSCFSTEKTVQILLVWLEVFMMSYDIIWFSFDESFRMNYLCTNKINNFKYCVHCNRRKYR